MAIYHCSIKTISRSNGRSATAASAYRSGESITDERTGEVHDYTKREGVLHTEIITPTGKNFDWIRDRHNLWNTAENFEVRSNARVARECVVALPEELNSEQRKKLVQEFSLILADRYGVAVDMAIHAPGKRGDQRNHHAHLLFTTRTVEPDGLGKKTRLLDDRKTGPAEIEAIRMQWESSANAHLKKAGLTVRIDSRSLADQGREEPATIHMGPAVTQMERKGVRTEKGDLNRDIQEARSIAEQLLQVEKALQQIRSGRKQHHERTASAGHKRQFDDKAGGYTKLSLQKLSECRLALYTDRGLTVLLPTVQGGNRQQNPEMQWSHDNTLNQSSRISKPIFDPAENMTIAELTEEIERLTPESPIQIAKRNPAVIEAWKRVESIAYAQKAAQKEATALEAQAEQWGKDHPLKVRMRLLGGWKEIEAKWKVVTDQVKKHQAQGISACEEAKAKENEVVAQITKEQKPIRERIVELNAIREGKLQKERQSQQQLHKEQQAEKDLLGLVQNREIGGYGWWNDSEEWLVTPQPLRQVIDTLKNAPKGERSKIIAEIFKDEQAKGNIIAMMQVRVKNIREIEELER